MYKRLFLVFIFLAAINHVRAQNDSIVFQNDETVIGTIKDMYRGVLKFKTSYSDSDFAIDWSKVKRIYSVKVFIVSSTEGEIYNGALRSDVDGEVIVFTADEIIANLALKDVVYLRTLKENILSRLSASLALGYNYTKSNNLSQINLRSGLGYKAKKWTLNASFNGISATQDGTEDIQRLDAALSYRYFLPKDWYPLAEVNWLANTEQNIELRTVAKLGMGKFIKRTNTMYWGVQAGTSYNNESFSEGDVSSQNSLEGFLASELNLYDIGDLSLQTSVVAYPGITESGRLRMDGMLDLKYDLPLNLFLKFGFTANYDNKSIQTTNELDYIFQTSFGWEL